MQLVAAERRQQNQYDKEAHTPAFGDGDKSKQRQQRERQHDNPANSVADVLGKQRRQPKAGGQHHQREQRFHPVHPASWARQQQGDFRHQRHQQPREGHTDSERDKNKPQRRQRCAQRKGDSGTEKRCRTRRRQQRGKDPFKEAAQRTVAPCRRHSAHHRRWQQHVEHAEQIERKHKGDGHHQADKPRVLELNAPAQRRPGQLQRRDHRRQQRKGEQDPRAGRQKAQPDLAPVRTGMQHRAELHPQHRQHAGHQIEDQTTEQRKQQHLAQAGRRVIVQCSAIRADREGCLLRPVMIGEHKRERFPCQRRGNFTPFVGDRYGHGQRLAARLHLRLSGQNAPVQRVEIDFRRAPFVRRCSANHQLLPCQMRAEIGGNAAAGRNRPHRLFEVVLEGFVGRMIKIKLQRVVC